MNTSIDNILSRIDKQFLNFEEGLDEAAQKKLDDYKNARFMHPQLERSMRQVLEAYSTLEKGDFIFIAGSTGVGKSALGEQLELYLLSKEIERMQSDRNYLPVVYQNAYQSESGSFDFKLFYDNIAEKIGDVLPSEKQIVEFKSDGSIDLASLRKKNTTTRAMRIATEKAFARRETHTFFIDEIQHMLSLNGAQQLKDRMDFIKSFTESGKVNIIMIGTYEALKMSGLSGQLGRRELFIDFPRYKCESQEELKEWIKVVWECQRRLPLDNQSCLTPHYKMLFRYSCGCTGILKKWINRALAKALADKAESITEDYLLATRLPDKKLEQIAKEIIAGERKMKALNTESLDALYDCASLDFPAPEENAKKSNKKAKKSNRTPGTQNPKIMKTGR